MRDKGTGGLAETARAAGAIDCSGPRVDAAKLRLAELVEQRPLSEALTIIAWAGRMGDAWLSQTDAEPTNSSSTEITDGLGWEVEVPGTVGDSTSAGDTAAAVTKPLQCDLDLLAYAGG